MGPDSLARSARSACLALGALALAPQTARSQGCYTARISEIPGALQGSGNSHAAGVSADGRWVLFDSQTPDLVPGDTNNWSDAFVRNQLSGVIERVSVSTAGVEGDALTWPTGISDDGMRVTFEGNATTLVLGDANGVGDVFVRDRVAGTTTLASSSSAGVQGNGASYQSSLSSDGRFVSFASQASNLAPGDINGAQDIFVRDLTNGVTTLESVAFGGGPSNGLSSSPSIARGGRFLTFSSYATNLVSGGGTGGGEVFSRDRLLAQTLLASVDSSGIPGNSWSQAPRISPDGSAIAFQSSATNLVPGDTNGKVDIFVRDLVSLQTTRVSVDSSGVEGDGTSWGGESFSSDARLVCFPSSASNLVPGDTNDARDLFVHDRSSGATSLWSRTSSGGLSNSGAGFGWLSGNGLELVFDSFGNDLVPGDTNGVIDTFVRDCNPPAPSAYCTAKPNSLGCLPAIGFTGSPSVSAGAGFAIRATNVRNQKAGLLFYSLNDPTAVPFQGGTLCLKAPIKRTPATSSAGSAPPANDCSGIYALDFNAFVAGSLGGSPLPQLSDPGRIVHAQWWGRDPGFPAPNNTTLSDALEFTMLP
jgi:Tol biopolymer transport system component